MAPKGLPRIHEIGIDGPVLLFTLGLSLLATLLVGSIPIFKQAGWQVNTGLREGGRGLSAGRQQHRARNVLVVVQVALALVLLICSGLMVRTFIALTHVQPGFRSPAELQTFSLSVTKTAVPDADGVARTYEEILHRVGAIPGVSSAGFAATIPMDGREEGMDDNPLYAEDHTYPAGQLPPLRRYKSVSPGFLATMGTPLIAGRDFTWAELYNKAPQVLISEKLARELWQDPTAAVGKRVREGDAYAWQEIIGVVADVHDDGVNKEPPSAIYWPIVRNDFAARGGNAQRSLTMAIRSPRAGIGKSDEGLAAGGVVGGFESSSGERAHGGLLRQPIARAHFVHADDVKRGGRDGAAARERGSVRSDCLLGVAADTRNRHPHRAGRADETTDGNVPAVWAGVDGDWCGMRFCGGGDAEPRAVVVAVQGEPG